MFSLGIRIKKTKWRLAVCLLLSLVANQGLSQIKEEVDKMNLSAKLILVGEKHLISDNENFYLALIEHLNNTNELRNIILEHSYAGAYLYNQFLKSGDTSLICNDFYFSANVEFREFWKKMYEFNKKLEQKIYLVGLDYDRSYPFVKALNLIIGSLNNPDEDFEGELIHFGSNKFPDWKAEIEFFKAGYHVNKVLFKS